MAEAARRRARLEGPYTAESDLGKALQTVRGRGELSIVHQYFRGRGELSIVD